jgi:hypothetical protein
MKKAQLAFALLVATGLAAAPFAAEAKSHKKHHSSQSTTGANMGTTGSNMRPGSSANPSSQGNVGPGTNQAGSMSK